MKITQHKPSASTLLMILITTLFCPGCGTIGNQQGSRTPNPVYGGTRDDCLTIAYPGLFGMPIAVVTCVDLPFSLVGDTLLLPVDLARRQHNSGAELNGWTYRPFPGYEMPPYGHNTNHLDSAVMSDYQDYINKEGLAVLDSISGYYQNGMGLRAIKFTAFSPHREHYSHNYVLIYDKENKRIKTIKWGRTDLRCPI
jgi:uncharacterized protein YceK